MKEDDSVLLQTILAELFRLQRWASGFQVKPDRVFGLEHGFETTRRLEEESFGVSEEVQRAVEDLLDDIERGNQSAEGMQVKDRLHREGVSELSARRVINLCRLQSRFPQAISALRDTPGNTLVSREPDRQCEEDWLGLPQYMELIDCTSDEKSKMYGVFAASIPRVGEVLIPQAGSAMEVIGVEHVVESQGPVFRLVPYVLLSALDEELAGDKEE